MENHSSVARRFGRSLVACLVLAGCIVFVGPNAVEAASAKITICHRTRAVTNPYRRITVSQNAVTRNNGHSGHTGGVFNTTTGYYNTNPKNWGDIIPGADSDGSPYNGGNNIDQNWDAAGKAIFLPTGVNASKCNRMTAKQYYDYQVAAGVPAADVITELNDMQANEDKALLASLGGTFSAGNLSTWATAIAVTTNNATSITDGTGSNGSAALNGSVKFTNAQAIKWYFELSTSSTFSALINTGETRTYASPNSMTADGTTQAVAATSVTGLSQGTYYFRLVGVSDYNTDVEGILYGDTKSFSILLPYITTETLPDGTVGSAYTATISATGGTGQKTNFRLDSGSLPSGLSITNPGTPDSTATLSGTPGAGTQGLYTLPFKADDAAGTPNVTPVKNLILRIKAPQTVTVPAPSAKTYGDGTFNINATSNVTADEIGDLGSFTSYTGTTGVCSVSSAGVVTILAAGSCTITANHSGNGYWLAGSNSVTFTISPRAITIKAGNKSKIVNGTDPTPSVSVTVGSLVSPDVLSGATYAYTGGSHSAPATIPNVAGSFTITPSAATFSTGSANNYTINYDTGTLTVSASAAAQTIDFPDPADRIWGDPDFTINATSKDGASNTDLQVSFTSSTPLVCTVGTASKSAGVSSVTVTILKAGTCTIETSQAGGSNGSLTYAAATNVPQSIVIAPKPITIKADDKSKEVDGANPSFTYAITVGALVGSDAISGLTYTHSSSSYTASTTVPNVVGSYTITPSAAVFSAGLIANYTITYLTGTLTVSAAATTSSSSSTTAAPTTAAPSTTKAPATTAAPTTTAPKVDPRKTTDNPFVNISADPKPNGKSTGGSLEIDGDPAMEVLSVTSSDPTVTVDVTKSGVEYNKPETWVAEGFGDECWKFEPGGSAYILPAVPTPPSGKTGYYSMVKVKAGSIVSTDPNFQVNTIFPNPVGGDRVWPDSNRNGIYDAGGKNGDKDISHVIVCIRYGAAPSTSTTAPTSAAGSTTTAPASSGTTTTVSSGSSTSSTSSSTTAPASSTSSTTAGSSSSTSSTIAGSSGSTSSSTVATTAPAGSASTAASTTSTTVAGKNGSTTTTLPIDAKDTDGPKDNVVIKIATGTNRTSTGPVTIVMRMSTGTEESIVKMSIYPATMEVAKVQTQSVAAVDVADTVIVAANSVVRRASSSKAALPATGSDSGSMLPWVFVLLGLGCAIRFLGRWTVRRRL